MGAEFGGSGDDARVGKPDRPPAFVRGIDHGEAEHDADLRRGKADARHRLHRVDHVVPDHPHRLGHRLDRLGGAMQTRIGIGDEGPHAHSKSRINRPSR